MGVHDLVSSQDDGSLDGLDALNAASGAVGVGLIAIADLLVESVSALSHQSQPSAEVELQWSTSVAGLELLSKLGASLVDGVGDVLELDKDELDAAVVQRLAQAGLSVQLESAAVLVSDPALELGGHPLAGDGVSPEAGVDDLLVGKHGGGGASGWVQQLDVAGAGRLANAAVDGKHVLQDSAHTKGVLIGALLGTSDQGSTSDSPSSHPSVGVEARGGSVDGGNNASASGGGASDAQPDVCDSSVAGVNAGGVDLSTASGQVLSPAEAESEGP